MPNDFTMVTCAHCGAIKPYGVIDSYGWLKLHCANCFKQFQAVIERGIVVQTKK